MVSDKLLKQINDYLDGDGELPEGYTHYNKQKIDTLKNDKKM